MTKENILLEVKKALENTLHGSDFEAVAVLSNLAENLLADVRSEANKKTGSGKVEKIMKDIFKNADCEGNRKMMQYSTIKNGKQYALDGHRLLELNTPINAPIWERDAEYGDIEKYYQVEKIMTETPELEVILPDLLELKAFNKFYKKSQKTVVILETVNGKKITLNSRYLENALVNFTNPKIYASNEWTARNPIFVVGEEGRELILPINFDNEYLPAGCYEMYSKKRFTLDTEKEEAEKVA